jgi:hypothetical protein
MDESERAPSAASRLIWAALCLGVLCSTAIWVTLQAEARVQGGPGGEAPRPGAAASGNGSDAPITDDPVIAPDPHESADNNVSFPVDI